MTEFNSLQGEYLLNVDGKYYNTDGSFRKILLMSELHNMKRMQESLVMKSLLK